MMKEGENGVKERRLAEREQLKKRICDAASEIILSEGFEKLSIRKIAEKIEYSPGVIYNYFKDKNEIIKQIITETLQRTCDQVFSLELDKMNPKAALEAGLRRFAASLIENRQQYKAIRLSGMNMSILREDSPEIEKLREALINLLKAGKESGDFSIQNEEIASMLLISAVTGLISTIVQDKIEDEHLKDLLIENHVEILVKGVSKQS